jgi:predicted nucleic acid-binding Zn ribbon protein
MPTYSFRDKTTGEIFDKILRISEREQFLTDNPNLEQVLLYAPQVSTDSLSGNQHRRAFKEVLNKINSKTAGSVMNKTTEL